MDRETQPRHREMDRKTESRLRELEKTVDALTDEVVDMQKRLDDLEDTRDTEIELDEVGVKEEAEKTEDDIYVA
ncbi:MAG: hypothetical protein ACLFMT_07330 [Halobacteriales archaeon]